MINWKSECRIRIRIYWNQVINLITLKLQSETVKPVQSRFHGFRCCLQGMNQYFAKCEMVLHEMDCEMNMRNRGYSTKLQNGNYYFSKTHLMIINRQKHNQICFCFNFLCKTLSANVFITKIFCFKREAGNQENSASALLTKFKM